MSRTPRLAVLLALFALAGCDVFSDGEPGRLRTGADVVEARVGDPFITFEVPVTYTNTTDETAYFGGCARPDPPSVQKRVDGDWVLAYNPIVQLCLSTPLPIAPGESLEYVLHAAAAVPGTRAGPEWRVGEVPGTYRLLWRVEERGEPRDLTSNAFRLTVE